MLVEVSNKLLDNPICKITQNNIVCGICYGQGSALYYNLFKSVLNQTQIFFSETPVFGPSAT